MQSRLLNSAVWLRQLSFHPCYAVKKILWSFNILQLTASLSGSLTLALAFVEKEITAAEIFAAIRIEENFKAKIYNEDFYGSDPAQEEKDNAIKADLKAAE